MLIEQDRVVSADLRNPIDDLIEADADANESASSAAISDVSGHRLIVEDFLRAIETNGRPVCDGAEGKRSVRLVQAIYESSHSGRPVMLTD